MNTVTFWDGDNFVIVLKNCDKDQAKEAVTTVINALSAEKAPNAYAEPVNEPEEKLPQMPPEEPVPEYRLTNAKYRGMTPREVLEKDNGKGYANLAYFLKKAESADVRRAISDAMSAYFQTKFAQAKKDTYAFAAKFSEQQCRDFFAYFGSIMTEAEKQSVSDMAGTTDFEAFLKVGTITQLRSLIGTVLEKKLK